MENIDFEKDQLRKKGTLIRKEITNKFTKSHEIFKKVISQTEFKNAKTIALYKSLVSEVDTKELIEYALDNNKNVVLPKIEGNEIKFYQINYETKFIKSSFGVLEPISNNLIDNIDLVILPGLCFDSFKNRLGFGKGFYDRFLSKSIFKTIGICFEEQIVDKVPVSELDIKIDKIITDKRIII